MEYPMALFQQYGWPVEGQCSDPILQIWGID